MCTQARCTGRLPSKMGDATRDKIDGRRSADKVNEREERGPRDRQGARGQGVTRTDGQAVTLLQAGHGDEQKQEAEEPR